MSRAKNLSRILVMGAGGRIGKSVGFRLAEAGYQVTLQNRSPLDEEARIIANHIQAPFVQGLENKQALQGHDIIVHTAGAKRSVGTQSRSDLLQANLPLIDNLCEVAALNPQATIISVTNPTKIICDFRENLAKAGLGKMPIYGTGLNLDTWRAVSVVLPAHYGVEKKDINSCYAIGDHESPILALKHCTIKGKPIEADEKTRGNLEYMVKYYSKYRRLMGSKEFYDEEAINGDFLSPANDITCLVFALTGNFKEWMILPVQTPLTKAENYGFESDSDDLPDAGTQAVGHLHFFSHQEHRILSPKTYLSDEEFTRLCATIKSKSPPTKFNPKSGAAAAGRGENSTEI